MEYISSENCARALKIGSICFPEPIDQAALQRAYNFYVQGCLQFRAALQPGDVKILFYAIFRHQNDDLGLGGLYRFPADEIDRCWLGWFGVLPEYRGKGVGKWIIERHFDIARDAGAKMLCTFTESNDVGVITFYQKLGFERYPKMDFGSYVVLGRSL